MIKKILIILIKGYQKAISPLIGKNCRFYPTCSQYAILALEKYGILEGGIMVTKRILKCNPFHPGGYDPI